MGIVDLFEVIHVEQQQRKGRAVSLGRHQLCIDGLFDTVAVPHLSERIEVRQLLQALVRGGQRFTLTL